ncbi:hypothetical protein [Arthrobacter sp. H20]|nr:hypothetical protein [Arthrobacter sp. H20]
MRSITRRSGWSAQVDQLRLLQSVKTTVRTLGREGMPAAAAAVVDDGFIG